LLRARRAAARRRGAVVVLRATRAGHRDVERLAEADGVVVARILRRLIRVEHDERAPLVRAAVAALRAARRAERVVRGDVLVEVAAEARAAAALAAGVALGADRLRPGRLRAREQVRARAVGDAALVGGAVRLALADGGLDLRLRRTEAEVDVRAVGQSLRL